MKISLSALAVLAIISIGLAVRLYRINQPLLEFFPPRQTQTAEITRNIYKNGWPDFWTPKVRYFTDGKPIPYVLEFPLYNGIIVILYHLFGPNIIFGRLLSLTFFIISSIIFYKLVQSTINNQQSTILALIFFVFSPLHILVSRTFQPEELAILLLLAAVYWRSWSIFSLAVLVKFPIALFFPVLLFDKKQRKNMLFSFLKFIVALLPSVVWYLRASKLTVDNHISRAFQAANWLQPKLWISPSWYFSLFQIEHIWIFTTLGLLFFILGIWGIGKQNFSLWRRWFISGTIYALLFNYHMMTHEYYHLLLLPPLAVIVGSGIWLILSILPRVFWGRVIALGGILLLFVSGLIFPAWKKIIDAPLDPSKSSEVQVDRYIQTTTF